MNPMPARSSPPTPTRFTDLGLTACALALGASLQRVEDEGARVAFYLTGVPVEFHETIEADTCQVSARSVVRWLEQLAALVRAAQVARKRGGLR